jgi:alpha-amylase
MRREARVRAAAFTWEQIREILLEKVKFVAQLRGAMAQPTGSGGDRIRDVLIYTVVHQPRRLRLPAEPLPPCAPSETLSQAIFDDVLNERYFHQVAAASYYPAVERFQQLLDRGFRFAIGFTLSFLEQAQRWDEELLDRFCELVHQEGVEVVVVEPNRSAISLWDIHRFTKQMRYAAKRLEALFGVRPTIADATGLPISDVVYHALDQAGFQAAFTDGRSQLLDWRQPAYLYHHDGGQMKLLTTHPGLSEDVSLRFSDQSWSGWPLLADRYAGWLADHPGQLVILNWDLEIFGGRYGPESGIFDFLAALTGEVQGRGITFITPSEAVTRYGPHSYDLPLPALPGLWARNENLDLILGDTTQQELFQLMIQAHGKALLSGNPALVDLSLSMAQADNLHLLQGNGRAADGFTLHDGQGLTGTDISSEIQQVFKNFIHALDACVA